MKIETRIRKMLDAMSEGIYEKEHIIAMALLCAIAGESIFLLGPPGTAKSLVARRLKLAFKDGKAFEYLMSRFSTPDEIFGPVSISLLKNEDRYERVVDGFLPSATIVFLDEIWKASPSIQNALLTAINERVFQNGRNSLSLPMKALIAASNELPAENEGLEALWDRFLVRMVSNCIQSETTFFKMIRQKPVKNVTIADELQITDELYDTWQKEIENIDIPDSICEQISYIRKWLKAESSKEEHKGLEYYVSDRRWKKCFHLLKTSAFLNGRQSVDVTDVPLLIHCLWNSSESIPIILSIVANSLTHKIVKQILKIEKDIDNALKQVSQYPQRQVATQSSEEVFKLYSYFYYNIQGYPSGKCLFSKSDYVHIPNDKDCDGVIYRDEDKQAWIVHAIYTGAPFNYKIKGATNVRKIKLRRCNGGVVIDGTPYGFERRLLSITPSLLNVGFLPNNSVIDVALSELKNELMPSLQKTIDAFATKHLFLSDDDYKVVNKYLRSCEKRTKELEIKVTNAKLLL